MGDHSKKSPSSSLRSIKSFRSSISDADHFDSSKPESLKRHFEEVDNNNQNFKDNGHAQEATNLYFGKEISGDIGVLLRNMYAQAPPPMNSFSPHNYLPWMPMNSFQPSTHPAAMMFVDPGLPIPSQLFSAQFHQAMHHQQQVSLQNQSSSTALNTSAPSMVDGQVLPQFIVQQEPESSIIKPNESTSMDSNHWSLSNGISVSSTKEKVVWSADMVNCLIEQYAIHLQRNTEDRMLVSSSTNNGLMIGPDGGLAHRAWRSISKLLSDTFSASITPKACKNKFVKLKFELSMVKWIDRELKHIISSYEGRIPNNFNPRDTPQWEMKRQELLQQDTKFKRFLDENYNFPFYEKMKEVLPESFANAHPVSIKMMDSSIGFSDDLSIANGEGCNERTRIQLVQQHAKICGDIRAALTNFQDCLRGTLANIESLLSSEDELLLSSHLSEDADIIFRLSRPLSNKPQIQSYRSLVLHEITSHERFLEFTESFADCKLLFQIFDHEEISLNFLLFPNQFKVEYLRELIANEKNKGSSNSVGV